MFRWNKATCHYCGKELQFKFHYVQMELIEIYELQLEAKIWFKFHYVQMKPLYFIRIIFCPL